jgi:hypothetical protein
MIAISMYSSSTPRVSRRRADENHGLESRRRARSAALLPQLVLRNTWTWEPGSVKPQLRALEDGSIGIEPASRDEPPVRRGQSAVVVHRK